MIYCISIQKGGVAKTTTAAALAQAAAYKGKRVLAVDLDPQSNLTYCFAADKTKPGSYEILHGADAADVIQQTAQGVDVIAASAALQTETPGTGTARRLQDALTPIYGRYDFIFIDTPPTGGELQYNALQAADRLLIPLESDSFNLDGLEQITEAATQFMKSNPRLQIAGIIFTRCEGRPIFDNQLRELITNNAAIAKIPVLGFIRKAVAIKEAIGLQQSLYDYAPNSKPAIDYMKVFELLMKKEA